MSALAVAIVALALASTVLGAAAPPVADSDVDAFMQYSAWAYQDQITYLSCTGTGVAHKFSTGTGHSSFRCNVESGGTKAVVTATALGPESLRVTVGASGFKADQGLGAIPAGKLVMDDDAAESALQDSAWGTRNNVDEAFCSGVGPYHGTLETTGYIFGAFDCATLNAYARQGPQVLVVVTGTTTVRVSKTYTR